jgi:adenylate cyclase
LLLLLVVLFIYVFKMAKEIEYKFLISDTKLLPPPPYVGNAKFIVQGYLSDKPNVRVRTISGREAYLTIKGNGMIERDEFEYEIPINDALQMLDMCEYIIRKIRYTLDNKDGTKWEIDLFSGLDDLVLAEIEVPHADFKFVKPVWLGKDVSNDPYYKNVNLAKIAKQLR